MKLQENIQRIQEMMGLITEESVSFPIVKTGSYTSPLVNCDRLHAFNDTGGKTVGGMNTTMNAELMRVYKSGHNPDITNVSVQIEKGASEYTVNWSVTINESTDGNAYVGLYSRGHGGRADWVFTDLGHASVGSCKTSKSIAKRGTVDKMILVKDYEYNKDKKIKGCQVKQLFYKYTLKDYPSLKKNTDTSKK